MLKELILTTPLPVPSPVPVDIYAMSLRSRFAVAQSCRAEDLPAPISGVEGVTAAQHRTRKEGFKRHPAKARGYSSMPFRASAAGVWIFHYKINTAQNSAAAVPYASHAARGFTAPLLPHSNVTPFSTHAARLHASCCAKDSTRSVPAFTVVYHFDYIRRRRQRSRTTLRRHREESSAVASPRTPPLFMQRARRMSPYTARSCAHKEQRKSRKMPRTHGGTANMPRHATRTRAQ